MMSWEDAVKKGKAKHYQYQHSSFIVIPWPYQWTGCVGHLIKRGRERSSSNLEQVSPRQRVVGVAVAKTMDK
ncbi:hypothetical protein SERLA73DRAFT_189218 [Serpula lacrymans var. lacrymans S7.3]|uniref:Uncharacterized protein n=1 Tax=Serpula lacrymans var. lacrymans (strain S7.3) TaxID=936435 RepID=F8QD50_SERL3|nr:hypothetical protein SERLA73DRAFT_189218 [Serpula lacrymans var. lacrymans S7.3]